MEIENRYLVLKRSDIEKYISLETQLTLANVAQAIEHHRHDEGRKPLKCVVVESDWPEYESTVSAIEARVDAEVDNRHYCSDGKWWELTKVSKKAFLIKVGMYDITLESDIFTNKGAAYKQKNKWLTKHNMFCPGD